MSEQRANLDLPAEGRSTEPPGSVTEVRFEHSRDFPAVLDHLGVSLLISTYQAGKVLLLSAENSPGGPKLRITFHNFDQPMGMAIGDRSLAIGTRRAVWFLAPTHELAPRIEPAGRYDAAFITRSAHFTGSIHCHDLAWCSGELLVVNTLFSCLCSLDSQYNFVPRWRPPFISKLAAEDRCHLNGLASDGTQPRYVTVLGRTDTAGGWRESKATDGCILDVPGGNLIAQGLSMPHSPRLHDGRLWVLDSGRGQLSQVDVQTGTVRAIAAVPGYARGLCFAGPYAFVGLSRIRETSVFGGLPIAEKRDELLCGVGVIEWKTGRTVATFKLLSGVEEIYDVQVLPHKSPLISGPHPDVDESPVAWVVPGTAH